MPIHSKILLVALTLALMACVCSGCKKSYPTMRELNDNNIRRLHGAYKIYMNRNEMTGPSSEEDLKEFLQSNHTAKVLLQRMGVESIDDIFVSERDGKPFRIRWGVQGVGDHAIVFEEEGVDGKRMVAFSRIRELDADQYEGYWTGATEGAKPGGSVDSRNADQAK